MPQSDAERHSASLPYVRVWLAAMALLIFCMVIVGGATRLTDSGLSITEWQPLLGAIPPLSEADWQAAFAKYKLIPEYSVVNPGMGLEEFKLIFWWEWAHRFLGRFIGVAFVVPLVFLAATKRLSRGLMIQLVVIFALGAMQGALGWYMVASGLAERVDVSQYRLAAHLTLAAVIFAGVLWVLFGLGTVRRWPMRQRAFFAGLIVLLIVVQIAAGGFVAGLDAGMGYNTWPLMEGALVPDGLYGSWRDFFENAMTVQYNHRLLAYLIAVIAGFYAYLVRDQASLLLLSAVAAQVVLGVWTLLWQVPLWLGLAHQGGALIVLAAALWNLHWVLGEEKLSRLPAPDPR